jgi:hypothetical protein
MPWFFVNGLCRWLVGVSVDSPQDHDEYLRASSRIAACRYLLSLYVIDLISWGVSRIVRVELLLLGDMLPNMSATKTSLYLTFLSIAAEFCGSYWTPKIALWFTRKQLGRMPGIVQTRLTSRSLAIFAMAAYCLSNLFAFTLYVTIGGARIYSQYMLTNTTTNTTDTGTTDKSTPIDLTLFVCLTIVFVLQYPFTNQFGDQAVDMAVPHWLKTFDGVKLHYPGDYICSLIKVPSNPRALSSFVLLLRLQMTVLVTGLYLLVRNSLVGRWLAIMLGSLVALLMSMQQLWYSKHNTIGITNEEIETEENVVPNTVPLNKAEWALVGYSVMVFGLPSQSYDAITSMLQLYLSTIVAGAVALFGTICLGVYLTTRMWNSTKPGTEETKNEQKGAGSFRTWMLLLWIMAFLLAGSGLILYFLHKRTWGLAVASIVLIIFAIAQQSIKERYVAYMFLHRQESASSIRYWSNVLRVLVNGPLLAVNWGAVVAAGESDDLGQLSIVVLVTVAAFLLTAGWFSAIDPLFGPRSLGQLVDSANLFLRRRQETELSQTHEPSPTHEPSQTHESRLVSSPTLDPPPESQTEPSQTPESRLSTVELPS